MRSLQKVMLWKCIHKYLIHDKVCCNGLTRLIPYSTAEGLGNFIYSVATQVKTGFKILPDLSFFA